MKDDVVDQVLKKLNELRQDRHNAVYITQQQTDLDQTVINSVIADAINALELLFIILNVQVNESNIPEAGIFVPITTIEK